MRASQSHAPARTTENPLTALARFCTTASWEHLSEAARDALAIRVLDSIGCAIGAFDAPPIDSLRRYLDEMGGAPRATLIGGGRTSPDRAALFNGSLIRYLDYNDSDLAPGETSHPSDSIGAVLAASELAGRSGKDFLVALAVAYQVQCRLGDVAPVRDRGFDHSTHTAYAAAAGVARALALDAATTAHAIAIAGTAFNALRVTRTGALSHWKGMAAPNAAAAATHAAFLAKHGITGPPDVFHGVKGFQDAVAGPFEIDWEAEDLEVVRRTILKKYNAEIHSQSVIEALLDLRSTYGLDGRRIERIEIDVFDVAYHIIGGGKEGDKYEVRTKEQADHSLPYLAAAAILDGDVGPEQYHHDRVTRSDVQSLMRRVIVRPDEAFSRRFPKELPARVRVILDDGRQFESEKRDYEGFSTRPMSWPTVIAKFERLSVARTHPDQRASILDIVRNLGSYSASDLATTLGGVPGGQRG